MSRLKCKLVFVVWKESEKANGWSGESMDNLVERFECLVMRAFWIIKKSNLCELLVNQIKRKKRQIMVKRCLEFIEKIVLLEILLITNTNSFVFL